jgi:molybdopterin-guanine dinucleotide biosynthesis protein A
MKTGVILAGGRSSRMGVDKCTILFQGKPLIYWPYVLLKDIVDEIIVSVSTGKDTEPLRRFLGDDIQYAEDEKPYLGPLSGIYSSFKMAQGEYIATIPCDSPLVHTDLYGQLFEKAKDFDAAVPMVRGFYETLYGVYKRDAMLKAIEKVFKDGELGPKATYEHLDVVALSEEEIMKFDPDLHSFFNINSFSDIACASGIFRSSRKNRK